jgi:hypothetical protein
MVYLFLISKTAMNFKIEILKRYHLTTSIW